MSKNEEFVEVRKRTKPNGIIEITLERYEYIKAIGIDFKKTVKRVVLKYINKEKAEKEFEEFTKKYVEVEG